jgi:integrase
MHCVNKTDKTIEEYLKRGSLLWMRAVRETAMSHSFMQPSDFINWLNTLLPELKPASRRQYIASSRQWLLHLKNEAKSQPEDVDYLHNLDISIEQIHKTQSSDFIGLNKKPKPWSGKTSSQKAKKLSAEDMKLLFQNAKQMRGKWLKPSLIWMSANIVVGLRPIEWKQATLREHQGYVELVIQNAKNTNGRANGDIRHMNLKNLTESELNSVRFQLAFSAKHNSSDESWNKFYNGIRKTIHRLSRATFKNQRKYPTLYSSRHQFSADAKSIGMTKGEVAALMGHAVDDTAGNHYGKKKHGRGVCNVTPNLDEVASVRQITPKAKVQNINPKTI